MTTSENYNNAVKDRFKMLLYMAVTFSIAWLINSGLWLLGEIFVLLYITLVVLAKLIVIPLRTFQLRHEFGKNPFVFVLMGVCFLIIAFIYDFSTVPNLWTDNFGVATEGTAIKFTIKSRNTHFVTYTFNANEYIFSKEQQVDIDTYEKLSSSPFTQIKYLPDYPIISYLIDKKHLKFETLLTSFIGIGIILSLYTESIEKWALSHWQSRLAS